ncbi:hypothetical protein [Neoroseomonas rubea]|uniref:hypothetical protein n=1 Tax=Neoroseomonas rubea TaxID=2748666 RepID=UPI0018DFDC1A|nr:hypothetical protein [Roseomonas rubea]
MPYSDAGLSALSTANGFTLWHYRTTDDRATVLAPGYFAPAAGRLLPGDIVFVQASDATAMVPIRSGTLPGGGVTVDGSGSQPALLRSVLLPFSAALTADAVARAILPDPLPGIVVTGEPITVGATVTGPIASVTFVLRTVGGADATAPVTVPVASGRAEAAFTAPPPGGGYRLLAREAADPTLFALSAPFSVVLPPRLLTEAGGRLLLEDGFLLLLA